MKEIYLLSGLGADKRIFDFVDLSGFQVNHIDWVAPHDNESIEGYAERLLKQIRIVRPTIIGVSFGGMVTVEMAKQMETEKVILISSAKTKLDLPFYFRLVGRLRINKFIPARILKSVNGLTHWFFGTKTKTQQELLRSIIEETDVRFLNWAIDKIVNWKNTSFPTNLIHIHGTEDRILPFKGADFSVPKGGHLMIVDKGEEISKLIRKILVRTDY